MNNINGKTTYIILVIQTNEQTEKMFCYITS